MIWWAQYFSNHSTCTVFPLLFCEVQLSRLIQMCLVPNDLYSISSLSSLQSPAVPYSTKRIVRKLMLPTESVNIIQHTNDIMPCTITKASKEHYIPFQTKLKIHRYYVLKEKNMRHKYRCHISGQCVIHTVLIFRLSTQHMLLVTHQWKAN
jgi:hypothetical protein